MSLYKAQTFLGIPRIELSRCWQDCSSSVESEGWQGRWELVAVGTEEVSKSDGAPIRLGV